MRPTYPGAAAWDRQHQRAMKERAIAAGDMPDPNRKLTGDPNKATVVRDPMTGRPLPRFHPVIVKKLGVPK